MQVQPAPDRGRDEKLQSPAYSDAYRGVILFLLGGTLLAAAAALYGFFFLADAVLLDASVALTISACLLGSTAAVQILRLHLRLAPLDPVTPKVAEPQTEPAEKAVPEGPEATQGPAPNGSGFLEQAALKLRKAVASIQDQQEALSLPGIVGAAKMVCGLVLLIFLFFLFADREIYADPLTYVTAGAGAVLCLIAAALSLTAVHYLSGISTEQLPEAPGLARAARVTMWILIFAAASIGLLWFHLTTILQAIHLALFVVNIAFCIGLVRVQESPAESRPVFPLHLGVLSLLGSRTNLPASILDEAERQMGIDLRSTWALTVVRTSLEPLVIGLLLFAWLSTSFTVVGPQEQSLVEHWGVPGPEPLMPGLHLHWPWPADTVTRIPVQRIQATTVGHEGQEEGGPENVLWAVEHAPNEFTLLLGNGRDLITVDATVQYRIHNVKAWRYSCQNPQDALRAIAYRAVMKNTVNHTLSEVLSENVAALTGRMQAMVQQDADALGLGVDVLAFTVGGMHPPVAVASAYQSVISAQIAKVTSVVNAQVYRNQALPGTEQAVILTTTRARTQGAISLAQAAGGAWSFRVLETQYRSAPAEFFFRRRLETLEKDLPGRRYTVVDSRFERDGGVLWLTR